LFFPEGIAFDGNQFNRTAVTAPLFNYLAPDQSAEEILVSQEGIVHAKASPKGEAGVTELFVAKPTEARRRRAKVGEPGRNRTFKRQIW
jgi:hypothetical protein